MEASLSQSLAAELIHFASVTLRDTIHHEWRAERKHPDRAAYHRGRRKIALHRAVTALQWAREELRTEGYSPRAYLFEMDMQERRKWAAMQERRE